MDTRLLCWPASTTKAVARVIFAMPICWIAACYLSGSGLSAQELALQKRIGDWSIYCLKGASTPGTRDCSVATSVVGEDTATEWLKLGFSLGPSSTAEKPLINMNIKIPRIDFFKNGIVLGVDGRQVGRAFIESCDKDSCETAVSIDAKTRQSLLAARSATFEYQINKAESVSLLVDVEELPRALVELENRVGLSSPPVATESSRRHFFVYEVQLRTNPYLTDSGNWGKLLPACHGTPAFKIVSVANDLKIQDDEQFSAWLSGALKCSGEPVLWVIDKNEQQMRQIDKEAGMYAIYDAVRDQKLPEVVINSVGGVPISFSNAPK